MVGQLVCPAAVFAHPGDVDGIGWHYERSRGGGWQNIHHGHEAKPANADVSAPPRQSRENICHDAGPSNYSRLQNSAS
jgi:hypothetical protein